MRGGVLLPNVAPDVKWVAPLYDPAYDRLWAVCEDLDIPLNAHGGTGSPDYGRYPVSALLYITEVSFYSQRPFVQLLLSGVFERFPRLKFVMTEMGCAWLPRLLARLDETLARIRATGATGEIRYGDEHILARSATEYFHQNCWIGVSQPGPDDAAARYELGIDRFMWGSDYPHDEGTYPYTREHLRQLFSGTDPSELRQILAGNAARLYDFDLDALAPLAAEFGPTVAEIATPLDVLPDPPNEALLKGVVRVRPLISPRPLRARAQAPIRARRPLGSVDREPAEQGGLGLLEGLEVDRAVLELPVNGLHDLQQLGGRELGAGVVEQGLEGWGGAGFIFELALLSAISLGRRLGLLVTISLQLGETGPLRHRAAPTASGSTTASSSATSGSAPASPVAAASPPPGRSPGRPGPRPRRPEALSAASVRTR